MRTETADVQTTQVFSAISRIERPTKVRTFYSYQVTLFGVLESQLDGFANLLIAERVEQYEGSAWYVVDVTRGEKVLRQDDSPAYSMDFEITRRELPNTPAVFQPSQLFYIGDTLADLDDNEAIAINRQVNDIAEMQDRQSDFTQTFKVRKTRAMRALFELSGEVGVNTNFPYEQQTCRLVQDGIEIISGGQLVLTKVDEQYYYVAVYSGNKSIFVALANLKLTDLTLASTDHVWDEVTQASSQFSDLDYVYPLCEPSNDGGLTPPTDDGNRVEIDSERIWPFVKVKTIVDEIFATAGYTVTGEIFTTPLYLGLHLPIVNLRVGDTSRQLSSLYNNVLHNYGSEQAFSPTGNIVINGYNQPWWQSYGTYIARYTATYKVRVYMIVSTIPFIVPITVKVNPSVGADVILTLTQSEQIALTKRALVYEGEIALVSSNTLGFTLTACKCYYYDLSITAIEDAAIGYGSNVTPHLNLPEIAQDAFIKLLCNMFALIPEANPRDHTIKFWNYSELYANIPQARDWSAYLSERDDEIEFKFGDYAQLNYMRYKDTADVIAGNGTGIMQIEDSTLPATKEMVAAAISYSDEVLILTDVAVSRIGFNTYAADSASYEVNTKIDPRIVYIARVLEDLTASPPYLKTLAFVGGLTLDCDSPKRAMSLPISFSSLASQYASLAGMLTRTNLRRAKFNLPAYEVAGFVHYVPIYLSQYKAYFYVNKINNYVAGKLCTIDLIKL